MLRHFAPSLLAAVERERAAIGAGGFRNLKLPGGRQHGGGGDGFTAGNLIMSSHTGLDCQTPSTQIQGESAA